MPDKRKERPERPKEWTMEERTTVQQAKENVAKLTGLYAGEQNPEGMLKALEKWAGDERRPKLERDVYIETLKRLREKISGAKKSGESTRELSGRLLKESDRLLKESLEAQAAMAREAGDIEAEMDLRKKLGDADEIYSLLETNSETIVAEKGESGARFVIFWAGVAAKILEKKAEEQQNQYLKMEAYKNALKPLRLAKRFVSDARYSKDEDVVERIDNTIKEYQRRIRKIMNG